jgi:hypothetical protein
VETKGVPNMREIRTDIEIDAPADRVWEILTDFGDYPRWNPFIVEAAGDLRQGGRLELAIRPPGRKATTFKPHVLEWQPPRRFAWLGRLGVRGIFDGKHIHEVEQLGENRSRYTQREQFNGVLVPFMKGILRDTEKGFEMMNEALKTGVESQPGARG